VCALSPSKRLCTNHTGGCVGLGVGLEGCGNSRPHQGYDPEPYSPYSLHRLRYSVRLFNAVHY